MASFASDDCFGSYDFTEDTSLSYTGQATGLDQTLPRYHVPGCTRPWIPLNECFYCSGDMQQLSPSPPIQHQQPIPIIQERAPTPNRTYAQAAAQALATPYTTSAAALAATHHLRTQLPQQTRLQSAVQRNATRPVPQRVNAGQRSYAQAVGQARDTTTTRRPLPNIQATYNNAQQSVAGAEAQQLRATAQGHQVYQSQVTQYGSYSAGQAYLTPPTYHPRPQQPMLPTQTMLQMPMGNLADMLRPEYTNNPRNVEDLVQGTQRGGHRRPMSTQSSGSSTPLTPVSPGAMSVRSGSSQQSRRTGSALRDPSLPHRCPNCSCTFPKQDDLRRHVQRSHTQVWERPYTCPEPNCPWAFVHPKDLRRHARQHKPTNAAEPVERFHCPIEGCGRSYTRNDNLQRHVSKDHYPDSGLGISPTMSRTTSQSSYHAQPYRNN